MIRLFVISIVGVICSATALGAETSGYKGLPYFYFRAEPTGVGPAFDPKASLNECIRQYDKQKMLVESLGYVVVDANPCAITFRIAPTEAVFGSFSFLK